MRTWTPLILLVFLTLPIASTAVEDPESLLTEVQQLRTNGALDTAADHLDAALDQLQPDHPYYQALHLERHYHLPMARIRQQLTDGDITGARATHTQVERFLRGHPQRRRFMDNIDRYDLVIRGRER